MQPSINTASSARRLRIVPAIVRQHIEDAAVIYATRNALTSAPQVKLLHLGRFDERLAAHLDALDIAGDEAKPMCDAALEVATPGAMFVATTRALQTRDSEWLRRLLALAESVAECRDGLLFAFIWMEREQLQGVVAELLKSELSFNRLVGIAACAMHRVDPGLISARRFEDPDARVRAHAYRAAGELGCREFVSRFASCDDESPDVSFWAAWAAVMLGDRRRALDALGSASMWEGPFGAEAFRLAMLAATVSAGHARLRWLSQNSALTRQLVQGAGWVGDPVYAPWLIKHMTDDSLARLAGESFSLITGADLTALDLERKSPENFDAGPNDNPDDNNVEMDADEGLPWPDVERVTQWWNDNGGRFQSGQRHFLGSAVTRAGCIEVLRSGFQRQRLLAAYHLCLLDPGTPLFEWRAPAWRQALALAQWE